MQLTRDRAGQPWGARQREILSRIVRETEPPTDSLPRITNPERTERVVNGIVRRLESSGESEIPSTQIGELVMDALRALDPVAYVRFASVYRNFREAKDFEEFISDLAETNLKD